MLAGGWGGGGDQVTDSNSSTREPVGHCWGLSFVSLEEDRTHSFVHEVLITGTFVSSD